MKQIFTRTACLFWALLFIAVFSGGTAVGQTVIKTITFSPTDDLTFKILNENTTKTTKSFAVKGGVGQIEAQPGLGAGSYSGLVYINTASKFKKGSYYTVELKAKAYAGTGQNTAPSAGTIKFLKGSNEAELLNAGNATVGPNLLGTSTVNQVAFAQFGAYVKTSDFTSESRDLLIGLRLDGLGSTESANKAIMEIDDLIITEYPCEPINTPVPAITSVERCGIGPITLTSTVTGSNVVSRWYDSAGALVYTGNTYTFTPTDYNAKAFTVEGYNTQTGCVSGNRATVIAQALNNPRTAIGEIYYTPKPIEVNVPTTFTVTSNILDNNHTDISSIRWYKVTFENSVENKVLVQQGGTSYTMTPINNEKFEIECEITPSSTSCYNVSRLPLSTQAITPLPVEIIYFTAAKQGNNVLLEWATASEENNTGFEVQVSQDGFNFRKLDFVPTKNGNTVIKQVYTFKDTENGKYGTRYYRLKQIDMDGQFEYFTTKAVSFGEVSSYSLKAFPNPFESEVSLELHADESGKLNVQVLDAMGRSVMTQQFEVSKGRSLEKIILWQSLPKGIYFVRTEMNGHANNFRILKK